MPKNKVGASPALEPRQQKVSIELTTEDLRILLSLASDALFRQQFIDTRMPGFRQDTECLQYSKDLVEQLRKILHEHRGDAPERKPGRRRGAELRIASGGRQA